jgi:hypothetical protein
LLGLRINSIRSALQARSAKWNEAPVMGKSCGDGL